MLSEEENYEAMRGKFKFESLSLPCALLSQFHPSWQGGCRAPAIAGIGRSGLALIAASGCLSLGQDGERGRTRGTRENDGRNKEREAYKHITYLHTYIYTSIHTFMRKCFYTSLIMHMASDGANIFFKIIKILVCITMQQAGPVFTPMRDTA
jgi:hypothetical protein